MDARLVLRCLSEPESEAGLRSVRLSEIAQKLTEIATFFQWAISNPTYQPEFLTSKFKVNSGWKPFKNGSRNGCNDSKVIEKTNLATPVFLYRQGFLAKKTGSFFFQIYRSHEGSQSVDKKNWLYGWWTFDQCGFWLTMLFWVNKIDTILHPKKPPFTFDGHDTGFP